MPPHNINYANNCFYKIFCCDEAITDLYVGRTCDAIRRKYQHKQNSFKSNAYLYNCIRINGGWSNWKFEIIEEYPCENSVAASARENYWINNLMATLNIQTGIFDNNISNKEYKRKWYFENQTKIREHQALYKLSTFNKNDYINIVVDTENVINNPEWIQDNMKNAKFIK